MLLDTHALVWGLLNPLALSATARQALSSTPESCVSAASVYEILFKASLGKWPEAAHLLEIDVTEDLRARGIEVLPITGAVMQRAATFDWAHRDPFDRIIVATAIDQAVPLLSSDRTLDSCPEPGWSRLW